MQQKYLILSGLPLNKMKAGLTCFKRMSQNKTIKNYALLSIVRGYNLKKCEAL